MNYNNKNLPTKVIVANTEWQKYLDVAKAEYIAAGQAYDVAINDANATMESLIAADTAKTAAGAKWEAAQATANRMAADARMATAEVTAEVFGTAWGADGEVLSHAETTEAIKTGQGWFDVQGRWVNMARMNKLATK
ncbi:MAG: hypothetical protein EBR82_51410 [Caulobacteraceae bacterium]|nr:hypothetical protein [Caulobacteraceae bacterium]